ncbi:hypothetical protein N6L24_13145 [Cognatishimia sp. SS12]|uniref:hypothetical protein n=1 Tax=Cognatishimia sp. SS12 TaxID=2979465 RepID=UPI00232D69CF|nr:hypothetical protein [Cognatishimia sp. SS12]MDC0739227.1 hypothetical protein [Cognatishimia sp. SS12]
MLKSALIASMLLATPAMAQEISECDWQARADAIYEPWEEFSRSYANGAVRLALLDTIEPAAGSFHLLVLSPPYDEVGGRQCRTIGVAGGMGFSGIGFEELNAHYDPDVGLIFDVQVMYFDSEFDDFSSGDLYFNLNQDTGVIEAFLE